MGAGGFSPDHFPPPGDGAPDQGTGEMDVQAGTGEDEVPEDVWKVVRNDPIHPDDQPPQAGGPVTGAEQAEERPAQEAEERAERESRRPQQADTPQAPASPGGAEPLEERQ